MDVAAKNLQILSHVRMGGGSETYRLNEWVSSRCSSMTGNSCTHTCRSYIGMQTRQPLVIIPSPIPSHLSETQKRGRRIQWQPSFSLDTNVLSSGDEPMWSQRKGLSNHLTLDCFIRQRQTHVSLRFLFWLQCTGERPRMQLKFRCVGMRVNCLS